MKNSRECIGNHLLLDLFDIDQEFERNQLLPMFQKACVDAGATILFSKVQQFGENCGTTGIIILAESHLSWHWYNEYQSMYIDLFTCGNTNPELAIPRILNFLKPKKYYQKIVVRGNL